MKLLMLTSNALRHRFLANTVVAQAEDALVVSECRPADEGLPPRGAGAGESPLRQAHFRLRHETERRSFADHEAFRAPATLPVVYGEVNAPSVRRVVEAFRPDACVVFGASIIREPLFSLLPRGRTVDLHLGLSPYYRGSGTNFWPFVNGELEYVGATLLHLDAGIDTGPIITHVRPGLEPDDTVHTAGCRVIAASAVALGEVLRLMRDGRTLPCVPQWEAPNARYYRETDFTDDALATYRQHLKGGLVAEYLQRPPRPLRLMSLASDTAPAEAGRA